MTQASRPQADNTSNGYLDSGPYTADQWRERVRAAHTGDANTASQRARLRGVVPSYDNMLVVTEPVAGTIRVGTGAGLSSGAYLFNSAAVDFAVSADAPAANPRIDLVCIVENNTNAAVSDGTAANGWIFPTDLTDYDGAASIPAYCARLVIVKGAEAGAPVEPALDVSNTLFMVAIAEYQISVLGVISAFVDRREFTDIERVVSCNATENDEIHDAAIVGVEVNDGVGAAGLGVGIKFRLENSAGTAEDAGRLAVRYTDAGAGDETRLEVYLKAGGSDNLSGVVNAPTAASVDGNARGAGAVDWQQERGAAANVASGAYAVIAGGENNTASGARSAVGGGDTNISSGAESTVGGGDTNTASAQYATVGGGFTNTATQTSAVVAGGENNDATGIESAICGGDNNTASGTRSFVGGGAGNTASGTGATIGGGLSNTASGALYATIGGGNQNTATDDYATVCGGSLNDATGEYATVIGGSGNDASGFYSVASGRQASAPIWGQHSQSGGNYSTAGDAQGSDIVLKRYIASHGVGTAYELYPDGTTPSLLVVSASSVWYADAMIVGSTQNAAQQWAFRIQGLIERDNAGNTTYSSLIAPTTVSTSDANYSAAMVADDVNETLQVEVTYAGGSTDYAIRWVCFLRLVQVTFP